TAITIKNLAALQSKITFGLTATSGNNDLVNQISAFFKMPNSTLKLDHNLRQQLTAARIESNQALKDFQLLNDIVQQLAGTYNNILNNDTNDVMRYLTVYSLILTIPSIVVGFYGMNMSLPLTQGRWAWIYAVIISVVLILVLIIDMIRRHFL
ncbi:CorA family divalent cation transporter, partial [Bombilactobacillus bombi]|uniref:CorA family divalent cation transporter n=1 Tax=Bombilactobacillus bombi TaxID=1303590 RepID=UPI0028125E42